MIEPMSRSLITWRALVKVNNHSHLQRAHDWPELWIFWLSLISLLTGAAVNVLTMIQFLVKLMP
jgi:hypothetical protein